MVRPPPRQGFTLIEVMMVLVLIGVLSAMIAPGLSEVLADSRQSGAAENLVRLHRFVRARVNETGLAHLVTYDSAGNNGLGKIRVLEGMNNHCSTTPWGQAVAGHSPVDVLEMFEFNPAGDLSLGQPAASDTNRQVILLFAGASPGLATITLCFQPNGMTFVGTPAGQNWTFQAQQQPVVFTVHRKVSGVQHGVDRQVVFPIGGNARLKV